MRSLTLRASLSLWFAGLAIVVLGGASAALYLGVRASLFEGLDAQLRARAEGVAALCEWEDDTIQLEGVAESGIDLPLLGPDYAIEIRSWPGQELVRRYGPELPAPDVAASADREPGAVFRTCPVNGGADRRVCSLHAAFPAAVASEEESAHPAYAVEVRVGTSLAPLHAQLARIRWSVLAVIGVSVLVVLAFAAFVSRRVTRPLDELGRAAVAVRAGGDAPMPSRGTGDEVDRLASILDEAFAALRHEMDRQRRFTADASHELRTPVSIVQNHTEVALRRDRTPAGTREALAEILDTAQRMGRTLEALLTLTRLDAGARSEGEPVELVELAREAAAGTHGRDEITIEVAGDADATVHGDRDLLRILLDNLIANAVRHARSVVTVAVTATAGDEVELVVRDDGPGMPAEERGRAFERFFRGAGAAGQAGAGLGLALVESIARVHGAACALEDAAPGLRVRVRFPRADAA